MVGDGHNDALALSKSDVSLAVNGCAETSLRAADAYAQKGGLFQVMNSLRLSQFYTRLIKKNVGLSLTYNLIAGSMAIAGAIDPLIAAILMPINSFIVIGATVFAKPKSKIA
jgi:Cu2+-exporting ATPase/Cu+-exporting ATPase